MVGRTLLRDQLVVSATNDSVKASKELELTHFLKLYNNHLLRKSLDTSQTHKYLLHIKLPPKKVSNNLLCVCVIGCICSIRYGGSQQELLAQQSAQRQRDRMCKCACLHFKLSPSFSLTPSHTPLFLCLSLRTAITCRRRGLGLPRKCTRFFSETILRANTQTRR